MLCYIPFSRGTGSFLFLSIYFMIFRMAAAITATVNNRFCDTFANKEEEPSISCISLLCVDVDIFANVAAHKWQQ